MTFVIAQLSDTHIGGPTNGSGERLSMAIDEINAMTRVPDLVLLTGDITHNGSATEWAEVKDRLRPLHASWEVIAGNHDNTIDEITGHRFVDVGPLRLVLVDSSSNVFSEDDASWLSETLALDTNRVTVVAIHHPPFETGIWWMDCVGLNGADRFEAVVRRNPHVIKVLSGHVHRTIQTQWDGCALWVCPSTSVSVAIDLDANHEPGETAEPPAFSLHVFTGTTFVSHVVPVGESAHRSALTGPGVDAFLDWARDVQSKRSTTFASTSATPG